MISISGGLLSALIDEANCCSSDCVQQGLLFGNKTRRRTEVLSDTQEDRVVDEYQIGITSYLNLRERHPFWRSSSIIETPPVVADRDDIVGLLIIRRDGVKSPSVRDVVVARHLAEKEMSKIYPFLILLIKIDSDQCSWVHGMHYSCFGVLTDSPNTILTLDLKVPSLSADSAADYKVSMCLNSDPAISSYLGSNTASMMSHAAASAIQHTVETELLAEQLIDNVKEAALCVGALEADVKILRQKLEVARKSTKYLPI